MHENKHTYPGSSLWQLQHLLPLFSALLLFTAAGCKQEVLPGVRQLKLSFHSASQAGGDAIGEIELFVFDDQRRLISLATGRLGETISLDCPSTSSLHCIAWGNTHSNSLEFPTLQPGDPLDKAYLALTPLSFAQDGAQYLNTPPDLYRGAIDTDNNATSGVRCSSLNMELLPATASIHITISGLPEATGTTSGSFTVEVSRTAARIDFEGTPSGSAIYRLAGSFNSRKEYIIPPFRCFPPAEGKGIKIAIFHDGKLLKNITQTSDRQPLLVEAGKALELLIAFSDDGNVEVRPPGWKPSDVEISYPK